MPRPSISLLALVRIPGILLAVGLSAAVPFVAPVAVAAEPARAPAAPQDAGQSADLAARVQAILRQVPMFDGHNDVPWAIRKHGHHDLGELDLAGDTAALDPPMHTDLARLKAGGLGAQFWSVYVPPSLPGDEAVRTTLEQIELVHRMTATWPEVLALATTAEDAVRIHGEGRIASFIGMEGGHSIHNSLSVLRGMYALGARYMTITHWKNNDWADAATDDAQHGGLTDFGREVIREMNRMGMLADLSHVSADTMRDTLDVAEAPVIFSHSGAFAVCHHVRNVPDDVLERLRANGGVVMVDFLPTYVSEELRQWDEARRAETKRIERKHRKGSKKANAKVDAWKAAHPEPRATLEQVADHIDHIRRVAGIDHLGLGSDFDGMRGAPVGLEDVSKYPNLLEELLRRGYTDAEVAKITGGNLLRVLREAEAVAVRLSAARPASTATIEALDKPAKGKKGRKKHK